MLGFGGLPGIAVALNTHKVSGYPSGNFVGIATGTSNGLLTFAATASNIPNLRNGPVSVTVAVSGQQVQQAEPGLTPTSLLAFTAGTSSVTDIHTVRSAAIAASS